LLLLLVLLLLLLVVLGRDGSCSRGATLGLMAPSAWEPGAKSSSRWKR